MQAKFTDFTVDTNWVNGVCGDYTFTAKLYDVGSGFGINGGRVSKLAINHVSKPLMDESVIMYDRGWDEEPTTDEHKQILEAVLELCENAPKRFA